MWLEYIRYRFRLSADEDGLELAQMAALKSLRNSPRCRGWSVLPAPGDPSRWILEIEWDPGASLTPFRGSEEFAELQAALSEQVRALEEADYRADTRLLRRIVGGSEALCLLAESILLAIMQEPDLGCRFLSENGSKRGRLGLWLLEVLGGPELFSSSFPDAIASEGPLAGERLDLEERERLIEIAESALPSSDEQGRCVLGALRAHLPLRPLPPSQLDVDARRLEEGAEAAAPANVDTPPPGPVSNDAPASHQLALCTDARPAHPGDVPASSRITPRTDPHDAMASGPPSPRGLHRGNTQDHEFESGVFRHRRIERPITRMSTSRMSGRFRSRSK